MLVNQLFKNKSAVYMIQPRFFLSRVVLTVVSVALLGSGVSVSARQKAVTVAAQSTPDASVLEARQWVLNGGRSLADFERMQQRVMLTQTHPLGLYVEYWNLSTRLKNSNGAERLALYQEIEAFLQRNAGSLPADLLRRDWLLVLGHTADWGRFDAQLPLWVLNDEREVTCYALRSLYVHPAAEGRAENILPAARAQFLAPRELGEGCEALADSLVQAGLLNQADVWQRIRVLNEVGYTRAAKNAAAYLPERVVPTLELITRSAALWMSRHAATVHGESDVE